MKTHYLLGMDTDFINNNQRDIYFKTHITDEETALKETYMRVDYDEHDTVASVLYCHKFSDVPINNKWNYVDYPINHIYRFITDENGKHSLGGKIPHDFTMPLSEKLFLYIGKISKKDELFDWLPFDLQIVMTLFCDVQQVYVDYTDPHSPKIINVDEVNNAGDEFEEITKDTVIEFEEKLFSTEKISKFLREEDSYAGIPEWTQNPFFPRCPKTNKHMRFVCQLASYQTDTAYSNIDKSFDYYSSFTQMDFWGMGFLYVFFEPESNVACFFIQNT